MYICTECDEKFKTKPKYCSCGNDEFKFVADEPEVIVPVQNFTKEESKQVESNKSNYLEISSYLIFILCLIFSVLVWFINPKQEVKNVEVEKVESNIAIPDIDEIWKDTSPKVIKQPESKVVEVEQTKPIINVVQEQIKKVTKPKENKPVAKPKQQNTSKPKTQTQTQSQKPVQQKVVQEVKKPEVKLPQSIVDAVKAPVPEQKKEPVVEKPVVEVKPVPKMSETEFLNYKGSIRSALLAKLNVVAIKGAGDCAIEFSVDNSGKLINRTFIYKSANKSVNDEVYNMLMRLPYFNQPPAHYNGEKIKLKFMFNNGYYEITFI